MSGHVRRKTTKTRNFPNGAWEAAWPDGRKPNGGVKWRAKSFGTKTEATRFSTI